MALPTLELQQTIWQTLSGDATLGTLVTGVFAPGGVPQNQPLPYVVAVHTSSGTTDDTFDVQGVIPTVQVDVFTQEFGQAQVTQILSVCDGLLHRKPLVVAGYSLVYIYRQMYSVLPDAGVDDRQHGVLRYRVFIQGG